MVLAAVSGTRLNPADPGDIDFLASVFAELSAILVNKTVNPEWRGLHSAGCILSEALGIQEVQDEPDEELELDSDTEDLIWKEDWEAQDLLEWILLEAHAVGLPERSHELQSLINRLELRMGGIATTPDMSSGLHSINSRSPEHDPETMAQGEPEEHDTSNQIYLLPTELFHNIFESVCSPRSLALFSPLILSHVNSHFRSIVLNTPSLWSTIDDTLPLPIAKLCLERSRSAPLDIRIGSNSYLGLKDTKSAELFKYLEPHAHRVKNVKMVTDDWNVIDHLEDLMAGGFPFGGSEKLEFGHSQNSRPEDRNLVFTLNEPDSLRELHLWGYALDTWMDSFPTALRRLQLSEVSISFDILISAVEQSPGLSILVLEDCLLYDHIETVAITAGRIVELQLVRIDWRDIIQLSRLMSTPALASLSAVAPPSNTIVTSFLLEMVKRNKEISSLEICDYDFTESLSIFKHLQNLNHLRVRASYSSDEDLQVLTMEQTLPNLTSITLDNELRLTTRLVEQMARTHPKLESIVLRGWDPSNVSADSLAAINKMGKKIFVETFMRSPEEDFHEESGSDNSDESSSDGSWLSGDDYVLRSE